MSEIFEFSGIKNIGASTIKQILTRIIGTRKYNASKISEWTDEITSSCLDKMKDISSNFKYIISCVIIQKKGAGIHFESAAHWDTKSDGDFIVREENESMVIVVTVYGMAFT
jgi:dynein light chain Tctex-type 1